MRRNKKWTILNNDVDGRRNIATLRGWLAVFIARFFGLQNLFFWKVWNLGGGGPSIPLTPGNYSPGFKDQDILKGTGQHSVTLWGGADVTVLVVTLRGGAVPPRHSLIMQLTDANFFISPASIRCGIGSPVLIRHWDKVKRDHPRPSKPYINLLPILQPPDSHHGEEWIIEIISTRAVRPKW